MDRGCGVDLKTRCFKTRDGIGSTVLIVVNGCEAPPLAAWRDADFDTTIAKKSTTVKTQNDSVPNRIQGICASSLLLLEIRDIIPPLRSFL